jgi:hypothetical protein
MTITSLTSTIQTTSSTSTTIQTTSSTSTSTITSPTSSMTTTRRRSKLYNLSLLNLLIFYF